MGYTVVTDKEKKRFGDYFLAKAPSLSKLIPKHLTPERVARIGLRACMRNPALFTATAESVWLAISNAAILGLEIDIQGQAYLVPFRNNQTGKTDCQLIPGYRGLVKLAMKAGSIEQIYAHVVYENDEFELVYGLNPDIQHKPVLGGEAGAVIGFYAVARFKNGGTQFVFKTRAEVDKIKNAAKTQKVWGQYYVEMGKKTAIRSLCKLLPDQIEVGKALAVEDDGYSPEIDLGGDAEMQMAEFEEKPTHTEKLKADMGMKNAVPDKKLAKMKQEISSHVDLVVGAGADREKVIKRLTSAGGGYGMKTLDALFRADPLRILSAYKAMQAMQSGEADEVEPAAAGEGGGEEVPADVDAATGEVVEPGTDELFEE